MVVNNQWPVTEHHQNDFLRDLWVILRVLCG
jgi:hypothetical protein